MAQTNKNNPLHPLLENDSDRSLLIIDSQNSMMSISRNSSIMNCEYNNENKLITSIEELINLNFYATETAENKSNIENKFSSLIKFIQTNLNYLKNDNYNLLYTYTELYKYSLSILDMPFDYDIFKYSIELFHILSKYKFQIISYLKF